MVFSFLKRGKKRNSHPNTLKHPLMDYRAVAATDVGSVREKNEDNLVFIRPYDKEKRAEKGCLAVVADGMGGHSGGEQASHMAIELIPRNYYDGAPAILPALEAAFDKANKAIYQKATKTPGLKGMGTTCTAVVLLENQIYLGHVGDSRAYLLKNTQLYQLSCDHTYVQHLLDTGVISSEEGRTHPHRNIITRAMGTNAKLQADFSQQEICFEQGDKLLLCSDGLYEYLPIQELAGIIRSNSLNEAAQEMIRLAKQRGGHDNISVLIVETYYTEVDEISKETQKLNPS